MTSSLLELRTTQFLNNSNVSLVIRQIKALISRHPELMTAKRWEDETPLHVAAAEVGLGHIAVGGLNPALIRGRGGWWTRGRRGMGVGSGFVGCSH